VESARTVARFSHQGPLRILQSLYPEGDAVCHNVLVHPPGGLVGGDTLDLHVRVEAGAHGLVTTPGASRFYRSEGETATQQARIRLEEDARLEWFPLEALYYSGCRAENRAVFELAPGAEAIGWDVMALGLPQAGQPFARGRVLQHLELKNAWLERGCIDADDVRLMDGPLGLAGHRCMATLFLLAGSELARARREQALDLARACIEAAEARSAGLQAQARPCIAGATAPDARVVVVRALAPLVEPALALLKSIRAAWRVDLWNLSPVAPRGWAI
jgi:urease accessory protein